MLHLYCLFASDFFCLTPCMYVFPVHSSTPNLSRILVITWVLLLIASANFSASCRCCSRSWFCIQNIAATQAIGNPTPLMNSVTIDTSIFFPFCPVIMLAGTSCAAQAHEPPSGRVLALSPPIFIIHFFLLVVNKNICSKVPHIDILQIQCCSAYSVCRASACFYASHKRRGRPNCRKRACCHGRSRARRGQCFYFPF